MVNGGVAPADQPTVPKPLLLLRAVVWEAANLQQQEGVYLREGLSSIDGNLDLPSGGIGSYFVLPSSRVAVAMSRRKNNPEKSETFQG